jgi:hypothetical protein
MVQDAEALEKPGRPTFFETPAWSFSIVILSFLETEPGMSARCLADTVGRKRFVRVTQLVENGCNDGPRESL